MSTPSNTRRATRFDALLLAALLPLVAAAGLPWWTTHWTHLYADAAALHVTAAAAAVGLMALLRRRRGLVIVAALTAGAACGRWAPAGLPAWPSAAPPAAAGWVLAHANLGRRPDLAALQRWVEETQPHAVSLQEVRTGTSTDLSSAMPGYRRVIAEPRPDTRGVGVWVRNGVRSSQARIAWLGRKDDGSDRPVASVILTRDGDTLQLVGVHTARPRSAATAATQQQELQTLAQRFPADDRRRVVWLGDFNATPWSAPIADAAQAAGLQPARGTAFWSPTWLPRLPGLPGWPTAAAHLGIPIDFALLAHPETAQLHTGPDLGSDHLPVLLRVAAPR